MEIDWDSKIFKVLTENLENPRVPIDFHKSRSGTMETAEKLIPPAGDLKIITKDGNVVPVRHTKCRLVQRY